MNWPNATIRSFDDAESPLRDDRTLMSALGVMFSRVNVGRKDL